MKAEQPHDRATQREIEENRRQDLRAGVLAVAALAGAFTALLNHAPARALVAPPAFALPHLAVMPDGIESEESRP